MFCLARIIPSDTACHTQSKKGVRSPHFGCVFHKNKGLSAYQGCVPGKHQNKKGTVTGV